MITENKNKTNSNNTHQMVDKTERLLQVEECELISSGYKSKFGWYYYCLCDPDKKEPMCLKCIEICHRNHIEGISINNLPREQKNSLCHCGTNYHIVTDIFARRSNLTERKCLFMEWSSTNKSNSYYMSNANNETVFCLFCANFCEANKDNLSKRSMRRVGDHDCSCQSPVHDDEREIMRRIDTLKDKNFENMQRIKVFNLLLLSERSFNHIYSEFVNYIQQLKNDIEKENFVFDGNIGYSSVMKSLENFCHISSSCKELNYFCDKFDGFLDTKFIFKLIEKKFDYKSGKYIWVLKNHMLTLYYRLIVKREYEHFPKLTIGDFENMTPLQRLSYASMTDDHAPSFMFEIKTNYIDNILLLIERLILIKVRGESFFEILRKLYSICKIQAKFNKISLEQRNKFCTLNDEVIYACFENNNNNKLLKTALASVRLLSTMAKCMLYLVYHFNDDVVKTHLLSKTFSDVDELEFFHSSCDVGKMMNKNCTNILNCVRNMKVEKEDTNVNLKLTTKTTVVIQMGTQIFSTENIIAMTNKINKLTRKVLMLASNISSITINYPDYYLVGLRRMLVKNKDEFVSFMNSTGPNPLVKRMNDMAKDLDNVFKNNLTFQTGDIGLEDEVVHNLHLFHELIVGQGVDSSKMFNLRSASMNEKEKKDKELLISKLRGAVNKTPLMFTIVKSLKIISNKNIPDEVVESIFKFLYFYIEDDPNNCIMVLTNAVMDTFSLLENKQLTMLLDFLIKVLTVLNKNEVMLTENKTVLKCAKSIVIKVSNDKNVENIEKGLKVLRLLTEIQFLDQEETFDRMRKIMKVFYNLNKYLFEFKNFIRDQQDFENVSMGNFVFNQSDNNFVESSKLKFFTRSIQNENISNADILISGYEIGKLFEIYTKFLRLINFLFDGNATLNETEFLSSIMDSSEIPKILSKKDLILTLRVEILKFFRIVYIDVIIDPDKILDYIQLFVNPINRSDEVIQHDDGYIHKFFQDLLNVNTLHDSIILESSVIKTELKYFKQIIDGSGIGNDGAKVLDYFENGIILPLYVFLDKFMSIIYNLPGSEYFKLYEIVLYFLKLKHYLILNLNDLEKSSNISRTKTFFVAFSQIKKARHSMIRAVGDQNLDEITKDLIEMQKDNFEILNYKKIYSFFERHAKGFIHKPVTKSIKELFTKKKEQYSNDELEEREKEFKHGGIISTPNDSKLWEVIVKYENDKAKFDESAFVLNLAEQSIQYDTNYRNIILRVLFYLIEDKQFTLRYKKQNLWHIFKLLQYDTGFIQEEILAIMDMESNQTKVPHVRKFETNMTNLLHINLQTKSVAKIVNLDNISRLFVENLLSVIFASCNPSNTVMNEDYFLAMTIIKIMKYMCEDHNTRFQTIFFRELKFVLQEGTVSVFDLMLGVLSKISILSKWEKIAFDDSDSSFAYFYDIFFAVIEFCIEMVQGTLASNLAAILKETNNSAITNQPFTIFLQTVKPILTNNNNDSLILYKVRKDIIDFIVAFLEENSTPEKIIILIYSIYNPLTIFESIVNTLKKLYIKTNKAASIKNVKEYTKDIFDHRKCDYFIDKYFSDPEFSQTSEFEFANRMYQFVLLLATTFRNEDAISIISSINKFNERELIEMYNKKFSKHSTDDNLKDDTEVVLDINYVQNYFAVKFFEKITRRVFVQVDSKDVMVLFTINPLTNYLSNNTKKDFYENVERESRYTKLFSLMEYSTYFYDEINYNYSKMANNKFLKKVSNLNYLNVEYWLFMITFLINIIMLATITVDDLKNNFEDIYPVIEILGLIHLGLNSFFVACWILTKFSLVHVIETKKYRLKHRKLGDEELSSLEKFKILFVYTLILKNDTAFLIWNIIFTAVAISSPQLIFLFAVELLSVINLSITLKNIIKAVRLRSRQFVLVLLFTITTLYIYSCVAFYFLSNDFIATFENNLENPCGSLLGCFLLHLSYGLRTDGGIGEHVNKISYHNDHAYFVGRVFYELTFFIVITVILEAIMSGIIIDTFAQLREETHKIESDKVNVCFICGGVRDELEKECQNYEKHITLEHDPWTYVNYMIGLMFVDKQETNAINSYVIDKIENKKISWFPAFIKGEEGKLENETEH